MGSVWAVVAARETAMYWMECLDFIGKCRSLEKSTSQKDVILLHKVLFSSVHTSKYYTIGTCEPHLQSSLYTNFLKFVKGWRLLWNVGLGCRIISKMPWLTFCQQQPCSSVTLCVCPVSRLGLIPWDHMCSFLFPPTLSLFWSFEQAPSEQSF